MAKDVGEWNDEPRPIDVLVIGGTGRLGRKIAERLATLHSGDRVSPNEDNDVSPVYPPRSTSPFLEQMASEQRVQWAVTGRNEDHLRAMRGRFRHRGLGDAFVLKLADSSVALSAVDSDVQQQIHELLASCWAVVYCGPRQHAVSIIKACLLTSTHYLDTCLHSPAQQLQIAQLLSTTSFALDNDSPTAAAAAAAGSNGGSSGVPHRPHSRVLTGCGVFPGLTMLGQQLLEEERWPGRLLSLHSALSLSEFNMCSLSPSLWSDLLDFLGQQSPRAVLGTLRSYVWDGCLQRFLVPASPTTAPRRQPQSQSDRSGEHALSIALRSYFAVFLFVLSFFVVVLLSRLPTCRSILVALHRWRLPSWTRDFELPAPEPQLSLLFRAEGTCSPWTVEPSTQEHPREHYLKIQSGSRSTRLTAGGLYSLSSALVVSTLQYLLQERHQGALGNRRCPKQLSALAAVAPHTQMALGHPFLKHLVSSTPALAFLFGLRSPNVIVNAPEPAAIDAPYSDFEFDDWMT